MSFFHAFGVSNLSLVVCRNFSVFWFKFSRDTLLLGNVMCKIICHLHMEIGHRVIFLHNVADAPNLT